MIGAATCGRHGLGVKDSSCCAGHHVADHGDEHPNAAMTDHGPPIHTGNLSKRRRPMAREYVGIDVHRRRSVVVRMGADGD
jgi:hypothetical protein